MIEQTSIRQRLWANLAIVLTLFISVFLVSYWVMDQTQSQTKTLSVSEKNITQEMSAFQESFMQTISAMNHYLLSLSETQNQAFNTQIDAQIAALETQLRQLGAQFSNETGEPWTLESAPQQHRALIETLMPLHTILINLKKATNAYVFLKQSLQDTIEFGLERSAQALKSGVQAFKSTHAPLPTAQRETLEALEKRLAQSQLLSAKIIATQDIALWQRFENQGLGTQFSTELADLTAQYAVDEPEKQSAYGGLFSDLETQDETTPIEKINQARNQYMDAFADLKDFLKTTQDNNQSLAQLTQQGNEILINVMDTLQQTRLTRLSSLNDQAQSSQRWLVWASVLGSLLLIGLTIVIIRSIVKPLQAMRQQFNQLAKTSQYDQWQPLQGRNELVDMSQAIQQVFHELESAISEIIDASQAQARGQLSARIEKPYQGDLHTLTQAMNQSSDQVEKTLLDIGDLAQALDQGQLNGQIDAHAYSGQFQAVIQSMNQALQGQAQAIDAVRDVTHAMREGDFSKRITLAMPGDLANLRRYLNESLDNLETAINAKANALQQFSQGNFSFNIQGEFKGKLLELKNHLDTMATNISDMLNEVRTASSQAVHGVREISSGNQDLNHRVQSQASLIESTAQQMGGMTQQIDDSLAHSEQVNAATDQMRSQAQSGMATVQQMVEAMARIQQASQEVSGMTELIDSIAFQTNLLALNAAVEAARAGEHGKGFAVVAGEVRNLAQKSAEAAHHIKKVTQDNMTVIEQGRQLSQTTLTTFEDNRSQIEKISHMADTMSQALGAQTQGLNEVNQALTTIEDTTQQNAALVEEVATTSGNIIDQVLKLEDKVQDFELATQTHPANQANPASAQTQTDLARLPEKTASTPQSA